jgi:hypothetical protein
MSKGFAVAVPSYSKQEMTAAGVGVGWEVGCRELVWEWTLETGSCCFWELE